ncbi:hypothetical protein AN618_04030 [Fervidicola ferrireducens]|uniref:Glycosyltransferase 2-like domain-containing protein n=1 Tax=Fervidicola ferrireducens TaxID=520764 RepID=A0A140LCR2_9FIRM|nr:glycosyltransferase [Fervidicola ferrireducens]KXG78337.1 hypothetical protein AN618_04030 [Fervidicola ferrireducens]
MRVRVAVCITTYKRPNGLARLLSALNEIAFRKIDPAIVDLEIIVVDNDPASSACTICETARFSGKWPLRYYVEPRRGISYARNAAVQLSQGADYVAFIDDDEWPHQYWLDELLEVQRTYNSEVVLGPVLPYYDPTTPSWVIKGRFFERPRYPTGTSIKYGRTGNALIKASVFEQIGLFDEKFALSGGEDTHFFMRLLQTGGKIIWADDAVVYEEVPKSRSNLHWILRRAYRVGNTLALCERELLKAPTTLTFRIAKALVRIAFGVVLLPPSFLVGFHSLVKSLVYILQGMGQLSGVVGIRYAEYK